MKRFFKILGIILGLYIIWSIIFHANVDKTQQIWSDMGVLEATIYLIGGTIGTLREFIISIVIFLVLILLKRKKKIQLDETVLFILGYLLNVIITLLLITYIISNTNMVFNIVTITFVFFIPLIHSLISFNTINSFLIQKYETKKIHRNQDNESIYNKSIRMAKQSPGIQEDNKKWLEHLKKEVDGLKKFKAKKKKSK